MVHKENSPSKLLLLSVLDTTVREPPRECWVDCITLGTIVRVKLSLGFPSTGCRMLGDRDYAV